VYLRLRNITKKFGAVRAVDEINLDVGEHEFVCILGPSGCGKTTLLRIVAGLATADQGEIALGDRDLMRIPARLRGFGIVFQSYSLFPNMTVAENIAYGLEIQRRPREAIRKRVDELLALIGMSDIGRKYPEQLSGGQQQRVALARALAPEPALLLLDEPLSALDAQVRAGLRHEIRALQRRLGVPTLMVTHDQEEAMVMADRIVCMNKGRIEQVGPPEALYLTPQTDFVANFIGQINTLGMGTRPELDGRPLRLPEGAAGGAATGAVKVLARPEHIRLASANAGAPDTGGDNVFAGTVRESLFLGSITRTQVRVGATELRVEEPGRTGWREGDAVQVRIAPAALILIPQGGPA